MRPLPSLALALSALLAAAAHADEVHLAVAANFAAPMKKIAASFAQDTGHSAVMAFGSTGKFYAQIKNGAPFQVLLAADAQTPAQLVKEGLATATTRFTYAVGRLVLWSPKVGLVDGQGLVLRKGGFDKIALADPKLAPYGAAAVQTLNHLGLTAHWQSRMVQGENITQTYQFVQTGNAALGFVALSQVMAQGQFAPGSAWVVPAHWHSPLQQDAVLLNPGTNKPAATALLAYLKTETARATMRAFGYETPPLSPETR